MKLSRNFSRYEFKCKCGQCDFDTVDVELVQILQDIRDIFGVVTITSGNRCAEYNRAIGGAVNSYHVRGRAADIQVLGVEPSAIADYLENAYPDRLGIGRYNTFTHVDTRTGKGRWTHQTS